MFRDIKNLIKENKKTFIGFLIMITSILIIFAYYIFSMNQPKEEVIVQGLKEEIIIKTTTKAPSMEKFGSYVKEKNSADVIMLLLVVLFFVGMFIIISSKDKK